MNTSHNQELETPVLASSASRVILSVSTKTGEGTSIPCRHVVTLLGSGPGCKVRLNHRRVEPMHVAIVHTGANVFAVDLASMRGSQLNGLKLQLERLNDGDLLSVGPFKFRIQIAGPERNGEADEHPFGLEPSPQVIAMEHLPSHRILRPAREICTIGRRKGCDIHLNDPTVSRVHALLFTYFGQPTLVDLKSANGTRVNDKEISFHLLQDEEVITLGESRFKTRLVVSKPKQKPVKEVSSPEGPIKLADDEPSPDLIDIQATEGAQRWQIAESLELVSRETAGR